MVNGLKKLQRNLLAKRQKTILAHKGVQKQNLSTSLTLLEEKV